MKCLVTGAAGFIASHLCRRLLKEGHKVTGVDCFTDFYPRWIKERNVGPLLKEKKFEFIPEDLDTLDARPLLKRVDQIYHFAAQAGVRTSWGENFAEYVKNNIQVTQKLLEGSKEASLEKFIFASSSSVYGLTPVLPMSENNPLYPLSPYGVTKLAAEQLCFLYFQNYGIPAVSLRFFTVYGPGQRPDMAFHKFFKAIAEGKETSVYGDGTQTRDFTYIDDILEAVIAAARIGRLGETYNVGGGHRKKLDALFPLFEEICQKKMKIRWEEKQKGEVSHTLADIGKARRDLRYTPQTDLRDGLQEEWEWIRKLYAV